MEKELKFDKGYLKRTLWIGMAFFGILLVWQLYNSYCSPMLSFLFANSMYQDKIELARGAWGSPGPTGFATLGEAFNMTNILRAGYLSEKEFLNVQWAVGIVMALDNIAALFIMPIFGSLSDKTKTKFGKRMPYIVLDQSLRQLSCLSFHSSLTREWRLSQLLQARLASLSE